MEGRFFVGRSGKLIDRACDRYEIDRGADLHITNALLCRPNRPLEPKEWRTALMACRGRLHKELAGAQMVIAVGGKALLTLTGKAQITKWIGAPISGAAPAVQKKKELHPNSKLDFSHLQVLPTFHPAFCLRAPAYTPIFYRHFQRAWQLTTGALKPWRWPKLHIKVGGPMVAALTRLARSKRPIAVDVETMGTDPLRARMMCLGFSDGVTTVSLPWKAYSSKKAGDVSGLSSYKLGGKIRKLVERILRTGSLIMQNGQHDVLTLEHHGLEVRHYDFDTLLAHAVVAPRLPHGLGFIATCEFHNPRWKTLFKVGTDAKGLAAFVNRPELELRDYNAKDALMTAKLWHALELQLRETHRGMEQHDFRLRLMKAGMRMQERGIQVDPSRFGVHRRYFMQKKRESLKQLREIGRRVKLKGWPKFNPNSDAQRRRLFFDRLKVKPRRWSEKTGRPQLDEKALKPLCSDSHALTAVAARSMLEYRRWAKLLSTYIDGLPMDENKVAHPTWKVWGCVPIHSQALTRDGWKTYNELSVGEEILAYDAETDTKQWTPILELVHHEKAPVIRSTMKGFTVESTPNHRWFGQYRNWQKEFITQVRTTEELDHREFYILRNAPLQDSSTGTISELLPKYETNWVKIVTRLSANQRRAFLQGFLLADGSYHNPHGKVSHWAWVQKDGNIQEALIIASYLDRETTVAIHSKKPTGLGKNGQKVVRLGNRRRNGAHKFSHERLIEQEVWCPRTKFESWVMRQGGYITITGNTRTGRWSSAEPNMQNVPKGQVRAVHKRQSLRNIFVARPGFWLMPPDYSALEARILAILSGDELLLDAFGRGEDVHAATAQRLFKLTREPTKRERAVAKTFLYGAAYGSDVINLWKTLAVSFPDLTLMAVQRLHDNFFQQHHWIKTWQQAQIADCREKGYVECPLSGRRQYYYDGVIDPNEVLNFPIQGTGSDIIDPALLDLKEQLDSKSHVIMQVHDEIVIETQNPVDAYSKIRDCMEREVVLNGLKLKFPVDVAMGRDWANTTTVRSLRDVRKEMAA